MISTNRGSSTREDSRPAGQPRISPHASAVADEGGLVVLHTGAGRVFKSNAAGARIWKALAQEEPAGRVAEDLAERYGIPARQAECDVARFIAQLKDAGLVVGRGE